MDETVRGILIERIRQVCAEMAPNGFLVEDAAEKVIAELRDDDTQSWKQIRDHFATRGVTRHVYKFIATLHQIDPEQPMFPGFDFDPLPGLEAMPPLVTAEGSATLSRQLTYESYLAEMKRLDRRIKSYRYRRRKPENLKQDQERLMQMKQFNPRFAQFAKVDPALILEKAKDLEGKESRRSAKRQGG